MNWKEPDLAEVTSVLPTPLELLRAVRGHSVHAEGGPVASLIAKCALDLAELHEVEQHGTSYTGIPSIRTSLLDYIEALLTTGLPHVTATDRQEIRQTIERIALASVELHRSLRQLGGADERVQVLCSRTAALADTYAALITAAARRLPWSPPRL